jgi:hypothetical protein
MEAEGMVGEPKQDERRRSAAQHDFSTALLEWIGKVLVVALAMLLFAYGLRIGNPFAITILIVLVLSPVVWVAYLYTQREGPEWILDLLTGLASRVPTSERALAGQPRRSSAEAGSPTAGHGNSDMELTGERKEDAFWTQLGSQLVTLGGLGGIAVLVAQVRSLPPTVFMILGCGLIVSGVAFLGFRRVISESLGVRLPSDTVRSLGVLAVSLGIASIVGGLAAWVPQGATAQAQSTGNVVAGPTVASAARRATPSAVATMSASPLSLPDFYMGSWKGTVHISAGATNSDDVLILKVKAGSLGDVVGTASLPTTANDYYCGGQMVLVKIANGSIELKLHNCNSTVVVLRARDGQTTQWDDSTGYPQVSGTLTRLP